MGIDFTARGSGYFRVFVNGDVISQHTTEREALERATEVELEDPSRHVHVTHDYTVDVEAAGSTPAPDDDAGDPPVDDDPGEDPPVDDDVPDDEEPEPDDEPDEPDPGDDEPPTDDEGEPGDDDPPTPPDDDTGGVVIPPPVNATWVQDWNLPDGTIHTQWNDPALQGGGDAGGAGASRAHTLAQPGPWGGTKVLENHFGIVDPRGQPQVGTYWTLPQRTREMYVETWIRYGPEWDIGPDNPTYPGNYDHKVMFLIDAPIGGNWGARWEFKVGVFGNEMTASAHDHDTFYAYMADPAGQAWPQSNGRLKARQDAWDGQWHHVRWAAKMNDPGQQNGFMRIWWDGVLVIDSGARDLRTADREFTHILFGANRNQGTDHPMSFYFGPAYVHTNNPGW